MARIHWLLTVVAAAAISLAVQGGGAKPVWAGSTATEASAIRAAPDAFISDLANRVFALLKDASLSSADRELRLRELARQTFDVEGITRFLAGRAWRTASDDERKAFGVLLEDYILRVYASRVGVIDRAPTFVIRAVRPEGDASVVVSEFVRPDGPPARAEWRVVKKGDGLRIADVSVEGISLALTQRDEFAAVIQRNGGTLAGLMQVMRQRIAEADRGK